MKRFILIVIIVLFAVPGLRAEDKAYLVGHITMCTGLVNNYPADSVNWFYRKTHKVIQYFSYFLFRSSRESYSLMDKQFLFINPYELYSGSGKYTEEDNYVFENKWVSPSGKTICEKVVSWNKADSDQRVNIDGVQYIPYAFANYIGIKRQYHENGQERLPSEQGLYHVNTYINGELAVVTFFEMKD